MYLIDFDRTLFRTDDFYESLRFYLPIDTSESRWRQAYTTYQQDHRVMNLFSMLIEQLGFLDEDVDHAISVAEEIAPNYLYPGAHELLCALRQRGVQTVIFTYGDRDFQQFKLRAAGMDGYENVITDLPKHQHQVLRDAKVCVDDSPTELDQISSASVDHPHLFRVRHVGAKYSDINHIGQKIRTVGSLEELTLELCDWQAKSKAIYE